MTIQSSSPRSVWLSCRGSTVRLSAMVVRSSFDSVLTRALGGGGLSSRMIRRISSKPACRSVSLANGGCPASSSYKQHPQRIDVAAGVDVRLAHLRLLGAHVQRRARSVRRRPV